eukprot:gnl/TRDRNA2_/TRDRNA2_152254_c1_seq2.p1 gnl/TRDRNA2_/TRDRNA2_152254_c1~~gnl/TRDRNA2_/TRDRNA2_152254_c1_seq2.p1  ORF type:complete len:316 (-),score=46.78 gnl/TRDRNA2_/TRDRNA2_152254_c1_seq2:45-992(-)
MNKKLGQHVLNNKGVLAKILQASNLKPNNTVFEVGPGTGALTMQMLPLVKRVCAYEIDPRMAREVNDRALKAGQHNLQIVQRDVLRSEWPQFDVCVANLPFKISSPFVFKLLAHRPQFRRAVIMFQKEFALRLMAKVGESLYGRLALNVGLFVKTLFVCEVPSSSFIPPPKVDSMVVKFVPRDQPVEIDFLEFDGLTRICFGRKNKVLRSSFGSKHTLNVLEQNYRKHCSLIGKPPANEPFKELVMAVLNDCGVLESRAITLGLDTYLRLLHTFNRHQIRFSNMPTKAQGTRKRDTHGMVDSDDITDEGDNMDDT